MEDPKPVIDYAPKHYEFEEFNALNMQCVFRPGVYSEVLLGNERYFVTNYDFRVMILSSDAILRKPINNKHRKLPAALDYSAEATQRSYYFDDKTNARIEETPARGLVGLIMRFEPANFRLKDDSLPVYEDYQILHTNLEIKIVDNWAAFYKVKTGKYQKYWDGILDYNYDAEEE